MTATDRNELLTSVGAIYAEHAPSLRKFIAPHVLNATDVDEVLHETFAGLMECMEDTPIEEVRAYLKKTAWHVIQDRRTQAEREGTACFTDADPGELDAVPAHSNPEAAVDSVTIEAAFEKVQEELPPDYVEAFTLSRHDGQTYHEISATLGLTRDQVKWRILKVRDALRRLMPGILAIVALAFFGLWGVRAILARGETLTQSLINPLDEHHCESLPDGSEACLEAKSAIQISFNQLTRNVEVLSGEVSFVVHSEHRPFDVRSGRALIHDVSTRFSIDKRPDSTRITVIEGHVKVAAPMSLYARTRFRYGWPQNDWSTAPEFSQSQQVEFDEATGRLTQRTELSEGPLSELRTPTTNIVDLAGIRLRELLPEISRRQPTTRFIYSPSAGETRLGGKIDLADVDSFLKALKISFQIHYAKSTKQDSTVITLWKSPEPLHKRPRPPN